MTLILGANPQGERTRNVVIARPDWSDSAVWAQESGTLAGGTTIADLTTDQPSDFVAITTDGLPLAFTGGRDDGDIDVLAVILANVTTAATIEYQVGLTYEEATGVTAADSSGNGNVGGILNGAFVQGKYQGGLALEGDGSIDVPNITLDHQGTFMGWFRADNIGTDQVLMTHADTTPGLDLVLTAAGVLSTGNGTVNGTTVVVPGYWYHFALAFDTFGNARIYLDSVLEIDGAAGTVSILETGVLQWGTSFSGVLDDLRYYKEELTQEQIAAEMASELATVPANLNLQFKLNAYQSGALTFGMSPNVDADPADDQRRSSFHLLPFRMTAQTVRIIITDASLTEIRIGRIFVGPGDQPSRQNYSEGYQLTLDDDTKHTRTPTGQTLADAKVPVPGLEFTLEHVPREEALNTWRRKYQRRVGLRLPLLVCLDPGADDCQDDLTCYGLLKELSPIQPAYYNGWQIRWSIEALL